MAEKKQPQKKAENEHVKISTMDGALGLYEQEHLNFPEFHATGIPRLDAILGGGLGPGLTVLGAESNLGKSTLALQIAQYIASHERVKVLYFSLEMDAAQLAAKSVYRQVFLDSAGLEDSGAAPSERQLAACETPIPMLEIVPLSNRIQYSSLRPDEAAILHRTVRKIREKKVYDNLILIERQEPEFTADDIREETKRQLEKLRKENGHAGLVVFVDYLQNLSGQKNQNMTDKQQVDRNVNILADLARSQKIPVIVISSLSRAGYDKEVSKGSFKESGNIEYSADVLLGLQLSGVKQKNHDTKAAMAAYPRKMELVVLKQRYGPSGRAVKMLFYPSAAHFMEDPSPEQETEAPVRKHWNEQPAGKAKQGGTPGKKGSWGYL